MSVKLRIVTLLAATTVIIATADADKANTTNAAPVATKMGLTVKTCKENSCNCTSEETTTYPVGECVEKDGKFWRLDSCEKGKNATLTSFATAADCKKTSTEQASCFIERYIKAQCEGAYTDMKVKLWIDCAAGCDSCGSSFEFENVYGKRNFEYYDTDLYFSPSFQYNCSESNTVNFGLYRDGGRDDRAIPPEISPKKNTCTPFVFRKTNCREAVPATFEGYHNESFEKDHLNTNTVYRCYGMSESEVEGQCPGKDEAHCEVVSDDDYFKGNLHYHIDKCSASDNNNNNSKTSVGIPLIIVPDTCQPVGSDGIYTMGTCGEVEVMITSTQSTGAPVTHSVGAAVAFALLVLAMVC